MYVTLFTLHHYSSCMLHMSLLSVFIRSYSRRYRQLLTTFMYLYACYYISYVYLYILYACFHTIVTYHATCTVGWQATEQYAGWWLAMIHVITCYPTILYIYAIVLSYRIILLLLLLYLYIYKQITVMTIWIYVKVTLSMILLLTFKVLFWTYL